MICAIGMTVGVSQTNYWCSASVCLNAVNGCVDYNFDVVGDENIHPFYHFEIWFSLF